MGFMLVVSLKIFFSLAADDSYEADLRCSCSSGMYRFSGVEGSACGHWW